MEEMIAALERKFAMKCKIYHVEWEFRQVHVLSREVFILVEAERVVGLRIGQALKEHRQRMFQRAEIGQRYMRAQK